MKAVSWIGAALCGAIVWGPAQAATVRYEYAGVVEFCDDSAIGGGVCGVLVSIGDLISGWALLDATGGITDRSFDAGDVLDYLVGVEGGTLTGATPENSEIDPASTLVTDSAGNIVDGSFAVFVDPTLLPVSISADLGDGTWQIVLFPGVLDILVTGGSGAFGAPLPTPLPGTVFMLGSALLAAIGLHSARR